MRKSRDVPLLGLLLLVSCAPSGQGRYQIVVPAQDSVIRMDTATGKAWRFRWAWDEWQEIGEPRSP